MVAMKYLSTYLRTVGLAVNLNHLNEAWEERLIIIQSDIVIESADLALHRSDYCVLQTERAQTLQHHNCRLHHYCEPQLADCADNCIMGQCLLPCEGIA